MGGQLRRVCLIFYDEDEDHFNEYHYQSGHSLPDASTASGSDPGHQTHTDPQDGPLRPSRSPSTHRTQRLLVSLEIAEATCPAPRPPPAWPQQGQLF